jgi:hypothetical protein
VSTTTPQKLSMQEVHELVRGSVDPFDDPSEPMIPEDSWEMLK